MSDRQAAVAFLGGAHEQPSVKIYRQHRCTRRHRTVNAFMRCAIRRAVWVDGEGPYALIAWCRVPSVTLWPEYVDAVESKRSIDRYACGGMCVGRHEIVRVDLGYAVKPSPRQPAALVI